MKYIWVMSSIPIPVELYTMEHEWYLTCRERYPHYDPQKLVIFRLGRIRSLHLSTS